jgi:hypothetical protein
LAVITLTIKTWAIAEWDTGIWVAPVSFEKVGMIAGPGCDRVDWFVLVESGL